MLLELFRALYISDAVYFLHHYQPIPTLHLHYRPLLKVGLQRANTWGGGCPNWSAEPRPLLRRMYHGQTRLGELEFDTRLHPFLLRMTFP